MQAAFDSVMLSRRAWTAILVAVAYSGLRPSPILSADLHGQIAVVTGGGRGLGRGIAMGLSEAGATVYITGRTEASLREACKAMPLPGKCIPKMVDSANDTSLQAFFAELASETGGVLDILVNNAYSGIGYWARHRLLGKPFWEAPMELFDEVFTVGVRSHYRATILAVPLMQKRGRGIVVNSNSPGCVWYGLNVPYGVGKCAIDKMTHVLCRIFCRSLAAA